MDPDKIAVAQRVRPAIVLLTALIMASVVGLQLYITLDSNRPYKLLVPAEIRLQEKLGYADKVCSRGQCHLLLASPGTVLRLYCDPWFRTSQCIYALPDEHLEPQRPVRARYFVPPEWGFDGPGQHGVMMSLTTTSGEALGYPERIVDLSEIQKRHNEQSPGRRARGILFAVLMGLAYCWYIISVLRRKSRAVPP